MSLEQILMMRHELVLVVLILLLLIIDLALEGENRKKGGLIAIILFGVVTALGFLPVAEGELFGGMYQSDGLRVLMKNILNLGVFIVFLQSEAWIKNNEDHKNRISEFFVLIISTLVGMNYMISSGDFLMFYLGLELATIPIAALAAYDRYKSKSAEAGIKLILSAALSSGVTLLGISFLYGSTGSVYFPEVSEAFSGNSLQTLALILFFSGLAFKISVVPFHLWTADVYEGAPISVTSYLSVISKGAAVFILMIILFKVFGAFSHLWMDVLYVTAILTMTIGNLFALRQKNMKRYLAFSSIAQAGFILLGILAGSELGMTSVIYFVLVYIFSNLGAFGVISAIANQTGKENRDDYNGLYQTNPMLALVLTLSLFSLAGIPPLAGFFGKFFLFAAAAEQGRYIIVTIAVINAVVSLYYYLLPVKAMFIDKNENPIANFKSDGFTRIGLILCVIGMMVIGFASYIFEYIRELSFGI